MDEKLDLDKKSLITFMESFSRVEICHEALNSYEVYFFPLQ